MTDFIKLKFVALEVVEREATKTSTATIGLFRGIRSRSVELGEGRRDMIYMFLMSDPKGSENKVKGFVADSYNIVSLLFRCGEQQELVVFKNDDEDQKLAFDFLTNITETLRKEGRMVDNDTDIIDISTYTDVPEEIKETTDKKPVESTSTKYWNNGGTQRSYNYETYDERIKREAKEKKLRETPALIKRKSALPTAEQLKLMKKMIVQIASGTYEEDEIPDGEVTEYPEGDDAGDGKMPANADCYDCVNADVYGNPDFDRQECLECKEFSNHNAIGAKKSM